MSDHEFTTKPLVTATRRERLQEYYDLNIVGSDRRFCCASEATCATSASQEGWPFRKGQLGHVGRHYDVAIDGADLRLMIVGLDVGRAPDDVAIPGRPLAIDDVITLDERYADLVTHHALKPFKDRNAHMRGTSLGIRCVFDTALGRARPEGYTATDLAGEQLVDSGGTSFSMFDAFAFSNLLLCSSSPEHSKTHQSTSVMRKSCLPHLRASWLVLEPTIAVIQKAPTQALKRDWFGPLFDHVRKGSNGVLTVAVGSVESVVVIVNHPAAGSDKVGWQWPKQTYYRETVRPALERAWELSHGLSSDV